MAARPGPVASGATVEIQGGASVIVLWAAAAAAGLALAVVASDRAVGHARTIAHGWGIPPFFVGVTLLAIGTDLPEMANSIVASAAGRGDINVGDSVGSAATQATLVLGLLPFVAGPVAIRRPSWATAGLSAAAALALVALLVSDGRLGRGDAALLITAWAVGTFLVHRGTRKLDQPPPDSDGIDRQVLWRGFGAVIAVAAGAFLAVAGTIEVSEGLGVPEFLVSFFAMSIGTSLPELVVCTNAVRRGEAGLALGDLLGSSFADATLSIGVGPLLFPTAVTASLAVPAAVTAAVALLIVTVLVARVRTLTRAWAVVPFLLYAAFYFVLIGR